jgi:hypothetical protein
MKRNAFGQLGCSFAPAYHRPFLRYFDGENGAGGGAPKEFKAPESQEELDRIVSERARRAEQKAREEERAKYSDYDDLKSDAEKFRAANAPKPKPKPEDGKPETLTEEDVEKRIQERIDAREKEKDLELAIERVSDQLDKALEGRVVAASKLFALDRKTLVGSDGKTVDTAALKKWVEEHSTEAEAPNRRRQIPGQGEQGETTGLDSGKSAYEKRHPKKN